MTLRTSFVALWGKALALREAPAALPASVAGLETARAFLLTSIRLAPPRQRSRWERKLVWTPLVAAREVHPSVRHPPRPLLYVSFRLPCLALAKGEDGNAFPPAGGKASARPCSLPSGTSLWLSAPGAGAVRVTCPELEPLMERPTMASSYMQE